MYNDRFPGIDINKELNVIKTKNQREGRKAKENDERRKEYPISKSRR